MQRRKGGCFCYSCRTPARDMSPLATEAIQPVTGTTFGGGNCRDYNAVLVFANLVDDQIREAAHTLTRSSRRVLPACHRRYRRGAAPMAASASATAWTKSRPKPSCRTSYHRAARIASRSAGSRTSTRTARWANEGPAESRQGRRGRPRDNPTRVKGCKPRLDLAEPCSVYRFLQFIGPQGDAEPPHELLSFLRWKGNCLLQ